jgi:hypothetical protein
MLIYQRVYPIRRLEKSCQSRLRWHPFGEKQVTSVALAAWTGGAFEMQNEFNGLGFDHGTMGDPERSWKFTMENHHGY